MIHLFRFLHVAVGAFWAGAAILVGVFLFPAVRALVPVGGPMMDQLVRVRKMPAVLAVAGMLTILSGVGLYWIDSAHFQMAWIHSGPGLGFTLGGLAGIAAAIVGMGVSGPTAKALGELGATIQAGGGPPSPEQAARMVALQARLGLAMKVVASLIVVALAFMSVARYLP